MMVAEMKATLNEVRKCASPTPAEVRISNLT